jgi:hypothetical protein
MSIPAGSRHMTSCRSDSWTLIRRQVQDRRHVARHLQQCPQVAVLQAAIDQSRRNPHLASETARLNAIVVLPTPPFGEKTENDAAGAGGPDWRSSMTWPAC